MNAVMDVSGRGNPLPGYGGPPAWRYVHHPTARLPSPQYRVALPEVSYNTAGGMKGERGTGGRDPSASRSAPLTAPP